MFSENEIWASGTGGTIVNSIDGGQSWRVTVVPGAEELDFRDIHAIDDGTIVAITSGTPARIYRSTNGGSRWKLCYENTDERVFLDALSFWDEQVGVVMGDPIDGSLFLLGTTDAGKTWNVFSQAPRTMPGEAGFAASGTIMITMGQRKVMIALGGDVEGSFKKSSRILVSQDNGKSWGGGHRSDWAKSSRAGFFLSVSPTRKMASPWGGDYKQPDAATNNYATTGDGGKTWKIPNPRNPPSGYRSCVSMWVKGREINLVTGGTQRNRSVG